MLYGDLTEEPQGPRLSASLTALASEITHPCGRDVRITQSARMQICFCKVAQDARLVASVDTLGMLNCLLKQGERLGQPLRHSIRVA